MNISKKHQAFAHTPHIVRDDKKLLSVRLWNITEKTCCGSQTENYYLPRLFSSYLSTPAARTFISAIKMRRKKTREILLWLEKHSNKKIPRWSYDKHGEKILKYFLLFFVALLSLLPIFFLTPSIPHHCC